MMNAERQQSFIQHSALRVQRSDNALLLQVGQLVPGQTELAAVDRFIMLAQQRGRAGRLDPALGTP